MKAPRRVERGGAGLGEGLGWLAALWVEDVSADGEVALRFAGGQLLRVHISRELVPYYRRMIAPVAPGRAP
jgi:hypothetical protein